MVPLPWPEHTAGKLASEEIRNILQVGVLVKRMVARTEAERKAGHSERVSVNLAAALNATSLTSPDVRRQMLDNDIN